MNTFPRLWHILLFAIALFGSTNVAVHNGWYRGMYFIDIPLHLIGGVIIGLFWWWLVNKFKLNTGGVATQILAFFGFVLLISFAWEAYEYISWTYFAEVTPPWELYSATVSDVLSDLVVSALGAILIALIFVFKKRKEIV